MYRTALTLIVVGLVAVQVLSQGQPPPAAQAPQITTTKVEGTDNVYLFRNQNSQSMFIVTSDGVIATDPVGYGRPQGGAQYLAEIRKVTNQPIRYVIYSHHHFDHIAGGRAFKEAGARFVAHQRAKERLEVLKDPNTVLPDETVDRRRTLTLGGTTLELTYIGPNHSDSTLVMRLPRERIVFVVDLLPVGQVPGRGMIDFYPFEAEASIKQILAMDWERLIPGHPGAGDRLGTKKDVQDQLTFLQDASAAVKAEAQQGRCWEPVESTLKLPKYGSWPNYEANLQFVLRRYCALWVAGRRAFSCEVVTVKPSLVASCLLLLLAAEIGSAQQPASQALDGAGAPLFRVDPFWPKPLPNRWSMQQVTGIHVDHLDHIWFLNRGAAAEGDEIGGDGNPPRIECCIRGPEVIELDQDGTVLNAWGGPGYHPLWPTALQTVIADRQGFVWVAGTAPQDSILKFTRDGKFVWDFGHRPPAGAQLPENNQQTDVLVSKGRFQLDEIARELYIINWKRVLVYDADTGAFKRGWGGHGMPLAEISNDPIPPYKWTGAPPPEEKNFVPDLHFLEISADRLVYVGERGQNRIEVFTTDGKWLKDFYVAPNTPARGEGCGGLANTKFPPCGTTYKLALSRDQQQQYLYVADGTNNRVWILDRQSGKTLGSFGGNGRYAGQLHWINAIAMDSRGNIYTGEVEHAKRIQKFAPVMRQAR